MARTCWASCLGGCDSISAEHIVSGAVFKAGCGCPMVVEGVERIRGGAPTRGGEVANILCRKHNSLLSPLDELAGKVSKYLHDSNDPEVKTPLLVEGELFERWVLKTTINCMVAGWLGHKALPSAEKVEAVFGRAAMPKGIALYSVDGIRKGRGGVVSAGVAFRPIWEPLLFSRRLAGMYVSMHGMPLFISFSADVAERLESSQEQHFATSSDQRVRHLRHPGAIVSYRKEGGNTYVGMSWDGLFHYEDGSTAPVEQVIGSPKSMLL
jgi:hypothetical protein